MYSWRPVDFRHLRIHVNTHEEEGSIVCLGAWGLNGSKSIYPERWVYYIHSVIAMITSNLHSCLRRNDLCGINYCCCGEHSLLSPASVHLVHVLRLVLLSQDFTLWSSLLLVVMSIPCVILFQDAAGLVRHRSMVMIV